ncbi:hypothetical protein EX30DRAFT_366264 [Ascodesmis nigricans]|uniref:Uncharacterized protein n=1 Tax=Ascodesmis nigricans TaxID=341454 RepID=A0A4V3SHY8_9PEZI|nr:hypothetical protein EX30DRAFT_366264 [Ascodesmis nigricans]
MSAEHPVFTDFEVPMTTYKVIGDLPQTSLDTNHDLSVNLGDEILIPYILARDVESMGEIPEKIPATTNRLYGGAANDAIQNDDVGLVSFIQRSTTFRLKFPGGGPTADSTAAAHAVAVTEESCPEDGWLAYSKGDPLWVLKNPVESCLRTIRSKLHRSPFAVKMANLRTGESGYVLTTEVQLYPHRKLKSESESARWRDDPDLTYVPLPRNNSRTTDATSYRNTVQWGDVFTTPVAPRQHWVSGKPQLVFVINHRTRHYGHIPVPWVRELNTEEQDAFWGFGYSSSRENDHPPADGEPPLCYDFSSPDTIPRESPYKASFRNLNEKLGSGGKRIQDDSGWEWPEETHRLVAERRKLIGSSEWVSQRVWQR